MFTEKVLNCKECTKDFAFTVTEQEFFAQKGFTNEPGRCPECRAARKAKNGNRSGSSFGGGGFTRGPREMFPAVCATCGKETTVPFQPSENRPVYCRECYVPPTRNNY
ncbi:MAG TPA: zinc-ribbon domain containing protein [Desulfosporosinus sp.]|nr:zinc-ribbon domain containing protein [Desulfosporosinus sp.]